MSQVKTKQAALTVPESEADLTPAVLIEASKAMPKLRLKRPAWRIKTCMEDQAGKCYWCSCALDENAASISDRPRIACIISPELGGINYKENIVVACEKCAKSNMNDGHFISSGAADQVRASRRKLALHNSLNHLMDDEYISKSVLVRDLAARFDHPRFNAFAIFTGAYGWITWTSESPIPASLVAAAKYNGIELTHLGKWNCLRITPRIGNAPLVFLVEVWRLIDHNGFIRVIELPGYPDRTPTERFTDEIPAEMLDWKTTFDNANDILRRRPKMKHWRSASRGAR